MEVLHFCKDGILRRSFSGYDARARKHHSYRVPLQVYINCVDPDAFLKSLHSIIVFEDGLTVGEMMENLAPWADIMTGVGCLDFPAFLEEVRQIPGEVMQIVDHIGISYASTITAVPKFDRSGIKKEEGVFSIGSPVVTDLLMNESGWTMDAFLTEEASHDYEGSKTISLSFTPMSEWKHLPIVIESSASFYDETTRKTTQSYLSNKRSITKATHPLSEKITGNNGQVISHRFPLAPPAPTFFNALICGFFWDVGFHYNPVMRDETAEDIKERVEGIDVALKDGVDATQMPDNLDDYYTERDAEFEHFKNRMEKIEDEAKRLELSIMRPDTVH